MENHKESNKSEKTDKDETSLAGKAIASRKREQEDKENLKGITKGKKAYKNENPPGTDVTSRRILVQEYRYCK